MRSKSVGGPCGHKFQLELFSSVGEALGEVPGPSAPGVVKSRQTWLAALLLFLVSCRHCPVGKGELGGLGVLEGAQKRAETHLRRTSGGRG